MSIRKLLGIIKRFFRRVGNSVFYKSGVMSHRTIIDWDNVRHIVCQDGEINYLYTCSNVIWKVSNQDANGFFRPCNRRVSLKNKIQDATSLYFNIIHPEQHLEQKIIIESLSNRSNYRKFINMGNYSDPYSRARKFYLTKDTRYIGINLVDKKNRGSNKWKTYVLNVDHYLKFIMNIIDNHKRNIYCKDYELYNANRQMATEAVAKLLKIEYLIPHAEFVVVEYGNDFYYGTFQESAKGISTEEISKSDSFRYLSPALQRELTKLNLLDSLCFERDHRPGNYNIIINKNEKVEGISVFDNDSPLSFAPFPLSWHSGGGSSNILNKKGIINRPYLNRDVIKNLFMLSKKDIHRALKPYLNSIQILSFYLRMESLKKAIQKSMKMNTVELLNDNEWTENTISKEIKGEYGKTYLYIFLYFEELNKAFYQYNHAAPL